MDFKTLLQKIFRKFGMGKFRAKDIYPFYLDNPDELFGACRRNLSAFIQAESNTYSLLLEKQRHHAVVDLRKLCRMGLLHSNSYKGRWQEYCLTAWGVKYLGYINRPDWEKDFDDRMELVATLSPQEGEFIREAFPQLARGKIIMRLMERTEERRYSAREKMHLRMLTCSKLARKYNIHPMRVKEILEMRFFKPFFDS